MPVSFALNHMTTPALDYKAVLAMANRLGMVGVEFRNDFADRVLVEKNDRLGNIEQIRQFVDAGWQASFSFEPFAKEIHELDDPEDALRASMTFINQALEDARVEG